MTAFVLIALAAFAQACAVAALLTPVARWAGPRLGMVDAPDLERKMHARPVPRSGGLALFAAFWGCLALNLALAAWVVPGLDFLPDDVRAVAGNIGMRWKPLAGIAAGAVVIFLLGAVDDARGLPPLPRLAVQVAATLPLLATGVSLQLFLPAPAGWVLTVLWVVLLTNSLNFLDNMNGLASGVAAIASGVLALLSALAGEYYMMAVFALLGGAAAGFWLHNFPRASIFLGDSGSTHLGFMLAALTIVATYYEEGAPTRLPVLMPVIVLGVPLFDTLSVLWIRWRSGKPLMQGDRNHFSHRLVDLGMTPAGAVVFIYGATLCVGLAAVALRQLDLLHGLAQAAVIALAFVGFHVIERVSRRRIQGPPPPKE